MYSLSPVGVKKTNYIKKTLIELGLKSYFRLLTLGQRLHVACFSERVLPYPDDKYSL